MGEVKRYSYSDLKAKHEAESASSDLHRRPVPAGGGGAGSHEGQAISGLEAELNGVWNIMKNVNASSSGFGGGGGGNASNSNSSSSNIVAQPSGTLPGLNTGSRTNYYSRYGGPTKTTAATGTVNKQPAGAVMATDGYRRQIAGDDRPTMLPKDEWKSFRSK